MPGRHSSASHVQQWLAVRLVMARSVMARRLRRRHRTVVAVSLAMILLATAVWMLSNTRGTREPLLVEPVPWPTSSATYAPPLAPVPVVSPSARRSASPVSTKTGSPTSRVPLSSAYHAAGTAAGS